MDTKVITTPGNAPKCPQCGTSLPRGALAGLCPACLLAQGAAEDTVTEAKQPPFLPPPAADLAPLFPQLEILELIGKGGMGAVYKARQKELDRIVALKILPPGIGQEAGFAERFSREAKALAKLNHPGIVTIHDFGRTDGLYYFVMEFVDGVNLRQLFQGSRISPHEALAIVPQICDALQFAHDHGIVHRDIKPENILMDRRGRVKVADFGLAKIIQAGARAPAPNEGFGTTVGEPAPRPVNELTEAGRVMGTPNYMAPEQVSNPAEVDHRADIYALGVVFYQMLTGELPGKTIEAPSKKVHIDVRLDEVVLRALERKPELRYQQASVFKTEVETIVETPPPAGSAAEELPPVLPGTEVNSKLNPPTRTTSRRGLRPLAIVIGLIVLLLCIGMAALVPFWLYLSRGRTEGPPSRQAVPWHPAGNSRVVSGPPFIADYGQGSIELIALAPHPSTNSQAWLPNGLPTTEQFPGDTGKSWAVDKVVKEIAFRIRSHAGAAGSPVFAFKSSWAISELGMTLTTEQSPRSGRTCIKRIGVPADATELTIGMGIADGTWQEAITLESRRDQLRGHTQQSGPDGQWEVGYQGIMGKNGDVATSFNFSQRDDWETRMVGLDADGTVHPLNSATMEVSGGLWHGMTSFTKDEFAHIKQFQLQRRKYEWVEFRNVSLQLGHRTTVEVTDAPRKAGAELRPLPGNNAGGEFGPAIERLLPNDSGINLASSAIETLPKSITGRAPGPEKDTLVGDGMERAGMDFAFMGHAGFYGMVRDMVTLERDRWDSYGPELLEKSLHDLGHDVGAKFGDLSSLNNPTNYTYGFKTHDRILGLLQITGFTDKPRTAKIRYKLAQSPIRTNEIRASLSGTAAKALQEVQDEQIRALRKAQQWNDTNEIQRLLRRIKATGDQIEKMINDAAQPVTATSNSAGASLQFRWVTPQADTNSAFDVLNHRNPGVTTPATIK